MTTANNEATKANMIEAAREHISNIKPLQDATIKLVHKYGASDATGQTSLTKTAYLFNNAVRQGIFSEEDARVVYKAYMTGYNANCVGRVEIDGAMYLAETDERGGDELSEKSDKTPVSCLRSFAKPAVVAQGLGLYQRLIMLRRDVSKEDRAGISAYNAMLRLNRAIVKACESKDCLLTDKQIAAGEYVVSDEMIRAACTPDAKKEKPPRTTLEKLERLLTDAAKIVKTGDVEDMRAAFDLLTDVKRNYEDALKAAPLKVPGAPGAAVERLQTEPATVEEPSIPTE